LGPAGESGGVHRELLVDQHGNDAPLRAAQRADELLEGGDVTGHAVWRRYLRGGKWTDVDLHMVNAAVLAKVEKFRGIVVCCGSGLLCPFAFYNIVTIFG
jgi:hypothetical protein